MTIILVDAPDPPGPLPHLIVGSLPDIGEEIKLSNYLKWAQEYGPIFRFRIFNINCYMISDPALVQEVLNTKNSNYTKSPLKPIKEIGGEGLFTTTNEGRVKL